ncbi:hypothetical protein MMPV_001289 [Pyropia vietnamensis]
MSAGVGFAAPPPLCLRTHAAAVPALVTQPLRPVRAARRVGVGCPPPLPDRLPRRHSPVPPPTASAAQPSDVEPDTVPPVDVGATKRSLLLLAAATDRGYRATSADTSAALALIRTLESANPTPAPTRSLDLLCGDWKLLYTTARDVLSLAYLPFSRVGDVYQNILPERSGVRTENVVRLIAPAVPFFGPRTAESVVSLRVRARSEVQTGVRLSLTFERAELPPPILGGVDLGTRLGGGVINVPLSLGGGGDNQTGWLDTTYLDGELRIGRAPSLHA